MITGDQGLTAVAVGRTLGLLREGQVRVLEAGELARLDANTMRGVVREVDVFARVAPAQKYEIVTVAFLIQCSVCCGVPYTESVMMLYRRHDHA